MIQVIEFKLRELIRKKGFESVSYRKLSKEIGISHLPLWKMVKGESYNTSLDMLDKLCRFFRCKPGDILEYRKD